MIRIRRGAGGKVAPAYGPSFEGMRRAGPPSQLEEETGSSITWASDLSGLPISINIIAEESSEVVARLRFEGCGSRLAPSLPRRRPAREPEQRDIAPTGAPERRNPIGLGGSSERRCPRVEVIALEAQRCY